MQYGPNDLALRKDHPPSLAAQFDQGTSQVGDDPPTFEAANGHMGPPLEGDTLANLTITSDDTSKKPLKLSPT